MKDNKLLQVRNFPKEDYNNMEFDSMRALRMILEADEADAEEEKDETEETNEEDETPKKKAPSRFKQDDDDVDTDTSTEDEDGEMDGSDADEDDNSDSDDLSDFGNHGGDELPNNEYDPAEVETLNNLMASEADAMNEYLDAARVYKVDVLQRLYADIANEERFHMEQLLFAKSELTGEKYVPRDKDVRKEYEELLELGMDEDSAMATAVDKVGIRVSVDADNDEIKEDMKKLEDDVATLEMMMQQFELVSYVCEYAERTNNAELLTEIDFIQESYFMEDITPREGLDKKYTKKWNPFKTLYDLIKSIVSTISKLAETSGKFMLNIKYRVDKTKEWVAKHGIGALFKNGVMLYSCNDSKNMIDIDGLCYLCNATWRLCQLCCEYSKSQNKVLRQIASDQMPMFTISDQEYNKQFNNPQDIIKTLNNAIITKTKIVVNDNNKDYIEKIFFGQNKNKDIVIDNTKPYDISTLIDGVGIYATFDYIVKRLNIFADRTKKCIEEMAHLEGEPNSIYHTNNELYNNIGKWMKVVGNQFGKLIKMVTNDMSRITEIGSGQVPNVITPEEAAKKQQQQQQSQQQNQQQ
jgi:rubrerythrin